LRHAQVIAFYALLDRLRAAHPDVEIETCASGGGRVDFEILRRCSRFWASDNNDLVERLRINAGWFDFLPLRIAGNHVGPSPNPITGRQVSMDFRAKVAMQQGRGLALIAQTRQADTYDMPRGWLRRGANGRSRHYRFASVILMVSPFQDARCVWRGSACRCNFQRQLGWSRWNAVQTVETTLGLVD
jgi:hypothetical protein